MIDRRKTDRRSDPNAAVYSSWSLAVHFPTIRSCFSQSQALLPLGGYPTLFVSWSCYMVWGCSALVMKPSDLEPISSRTISLKHWLIQGWACVVSKSHLRLSLKLWLEFWQNWTCSLQLALGPGSMKIGSPRDSLPEIERRADGTLNTVWLLKT